MTTKKIWHRQLMCVIALLLAVFSAAPGYAQTALSATKMEFDPSSDHNTVGPDGQPTLQKYELQIFLTGAAQPFLVDSLGKPSPDADGKIRVNLKTLLIPWPAGGVSHQLLVAAVGPAGSSPSALSNVFQFQAAGCTYGLSATSQAVAATGASGTVTVTAGSGCAWTTTASTSWITMTPTSGTGNGSVGYTVAANTTTSTRSGTLTIGGQLFTVTQAPATSCTYSVSPTNRAIAASGASGVITVTAGAGCAWTATANNSWITVTPATGSGNGSVSYVVGILTSGTRTGTVTIGGQTFTITQGTPPMSPSTPGNVRISTS